MERERWKKEPKMCGDFNLLSLASGGVAFGK
jgi:hypothetical protein